jgi:hypothetical protein
MLPGFAAYVFIICVYVCMCMDISTYIHSMHSHTLRTQLHAFNTRIRFHEHKCCTHAHTGAVGLTAGCLVTTVTYTQHTNACMHHTHTISRTQNAVHTYRSRRFDGRLLGHDSRTQSAHKCTHTISRTQMLQIYTHTGAVGLMAGCLVMTAAVTPIPASFVATTRNVYVFRWLSPVYACVCVCVCRSDCMYVCTFVATTRNVYVFRWLSPVYACVCVCMYVCMYVR